MTLCHWLIYILSQRLVAHTVRERCFHSFVTAISRTNSNQFEFVPLIAATKFCRSDKDCRRIAPCYTRQHVAATCRRDMLQRLVAEHKCRAHERNTVIPPGIEPRPLEPEYNALASRPPRLPSIGYEIYNVVYISCIWMNPWCATIQTKAFELYFHVVHFFLSHCEKRNP